MFTQCDTNAYFDMSVENNTLDLTETTIVNQDDRSVYHIYWDSYDRLSMVYQTYFGILGLVFLVFSLAGNITVIILFARFRSLRSTSNMFVINLTVADSILSIGNIPMFIASSFNGTWLFGYTGCQIYAFVGSISSFVSINTLAAMAIERAIVLLKPLPIQNRISKRYFVITIAFLWMYSAFWATLPLVGFGRFILEGTETSCSFDFLTQSVFNRLYVIAILIAHFIFPVGIIICSYTLIYRAIVFHQRMFSDTGNTSEGEMTRPLRVRKSSPGMHYETKVAKASIIVITVFCASWTPYATVAIIGVFSDVRIITRLGAGIPCVFAKFSTVVNPFLYALLHPKFRKKLRTVCSCFSVKSHSKNTGDQGRVLHFRSTKLDGSPDSPVQATTSYV